MHAGDPKPRPEAKPSRSSTEFAEQVSGMFDRISPVYDLMNRAMTAGLDRTWRRLAADRAALRPAQRALDVCCGTGDLSLELADRVGNDGSVIGCDFSERMLDIARNKAAESGFSNARFEWADALELPYPDETFDAVTVGFGVRNLADLGRGLSEMHRTLVPGGRMVILEITQPTRRPLSTFYRVWFDRIVPLLGRLAGDPEAYSYLPESVRAFPAPKELARKMHATGFRSVRYRIIAGGIITVHSGTKPQS